ncbi:MAG TPA: alpha/beta hydrolase [Jatrophihabitans sp.]|nr:alpha/beta hydrolase [Jatrophihabitans sp.]
MRTRRWLLGTLGSLAIGGLAGCSGRPHPAARDTAGVDALPFQQYSYGDDPAQWGRLYRPSGRSAGTVVVIHGGFWRSEYGAELGTPLAQDLARRGWTAWNIEYRRVGNGGGWPNTLTDVGAAIDRLATLEVDTTKVIALGHSAGGQLAAWSAAREAAAVPITGVVSQAGVLDLVAAAQRGVGGSAVPDLLGGTPAQVPDRYQVADPRQHVPLPVPVRCLHAAADRNVPYWQSTDYVQAARAAGADASLTTVPGDHFTLIDTGAPAWQAALAALAELS